LAAVLVRTFAVYVQMPAMLAQKNAKNMRKWAWIIAASVQKPADGALKRVKKWQRQFNLQYLSLMNMGGVIIIMVTFFY